MTIMPKSDRLSNKRDHRILASKMFYRVVERYENTIVDSMKVKQNERAGQREDGVKKKKE